MTGDPPVRSWPPDFRRIPSLRRPTRQTILLAAGIAGFVLIVSAILFARQVSALRAHRATGPNWSFPSGVYSNGFSLEVGHKASDDYFQEHLRARRYRRVRGSPAVPGTWALDRGGYSIFLRGFPDELDPAGSGGPEKVFVRIVDGSIVSVDRLGGVPGATPPDVDHPPRLEPELVSMLFDKERMWRTFVSLDRVPQHVRDAIIASEDRRYFSHFGIDPVGAVRALTVNMREGGIRQGGSTITQQLARGLFLGRERTLVRKLGEIPLAVGLELLLSKKQILEMYLNSVYWGQAEGFAVGGVAQAARWYFDVPVESLTVVQGATLAAMIPAPNLYNPFVDPQRVRNRRNLVLRLLADTKKLTPEEAARLSRTPLRLRRGARPVERFPSYSSYVNDVIEGQVQRHAAANFGLSIFTTMDLAWQETAENEIESGLRRLGRELEGAFVAIEPSNASVLAMVGGRAAESGNFNRAFQARRQTGSAIKPIVYAAALAAGFTPSSVLPDTQTTYGRGKNAWTPRNFDGVYHEQVTLAKALENSLNVATTALVQQLGPQQVVEVAARFGLRGLKPVMSVGLGSNEVSLLQITNAFGVFAADGMLWTASPLRTVVDRTGRRVAGPSEEASDAIPSGIASLMTGLLQNVTRYGVAAGLRGAYGFERPVAGKTGTTNDFHDAWFIGFTPEVVAGVWVGYDRPRSIGQQASRTALPLWAKTVGHMLRGFKPTEFASDTHLEWVNMNPWWGCMVMDMLTPAERTPFLRGTAPMNVCLPDSMYRFQYADSIYSDVDSAWTDTTGVEGEESDTALVDTSEIRRRAP